MPDTLQQGTKRKRYERKEEDISVKIAGKLHHDLKEVRKAAKKSKTFETQKLVKRLKGLREKKAPEDEIADCEVQLEAIKATDHAPIANTALKTKINKDHLLSEDTRVQAAVTKELLNNILDPAEPGSALAKVHGRLLSSKALAVEVAAAVDDLKAVLRPKTKETTELQGEGGVEESTERPNKIKKGGATSERGHLSVVEETSDIVAAREDEASWEAGSAGGDHEEGDADGWESGSIHSGSEHMDNDTSFDDDSDDDLGSQASPPKKPSDSKAKVATAKAPAAKSQFLPSLSVGFIRGDSDSDFSDTEANPVNVRKNRRGQQARRAIWEKKFGQNANHAKKQRAEMLVAAAKQDQVRATQSRTSRGKPEDGTSQQHRQQADTGWAQRTQPTASVIPSHPPIRRHKEQQQPREQTLHPSWEAKKKMKEKQTGIVPSQGTKIVF